jgi:molybdopterin-guanine dinucleotide biosynthesis protein B
VLVIGGQRWALLAEAPHGPPGLAALASRLAPVDLVLVEGFKNDDLPKLEVFRPALGKPAIWPQAGGIIAVATDAAQLACPHPVLPLNDLPAIAAWVMAFAARSAAPATVDAGSRT